jgi:hypothetical protein
MWALRAQLGHHWHTAVVPSFVPIAKVASCGLESRKPTEEAWNFSFSVSVLYNHFNMFLVPYLNSMQTLLHKHCFRLRLWSATLEALTILNGSSCSSLVSPDELSNNRPSKCARVRPLNSFLAVTTTHGYFSISSGTTEFFRGKNSY